MIKEVSLAEIDFAGKRKNNGQIPRDILEFVEKNIECAEVDVSGRNAQGVVSLYARTIKQRSLQEKIRVVRRDERVFLVRKDVLDA